jgi:CheY-like chemotaxis protein
MDQRNLKILIADDEKEVAEILGKLIELDGHNVTVTFDGQKALEIYQKEKFDLVFADISMPGIDGIDLTRKLLEVNKNTRVVVITGHVGSAEVEKAMNAGAKKFMKKPFTKKDIDQTIQGILKIG